MIAIKNRGEPDSTFRQSKDASGLPSVCGEIGQRGIKEAPGGLNRAGFRVPEKRITWTQWPSASLSVVHG